MQERNVILFVGAAAAACVASVAPLPYPSESDDQVLERQAARHLQEVGAHIVWTNEVRQQPRRYRVAWPFRNPRVSYVSTCRSVGSRGVDAVELEGPTDECIESLLLCRNLSRLTLKNSDMSHEDLARLDALPRLFQFDLSGKTVNRSIIEGLHGLRANYLFLKNTSLTDGDWKRVGAIPSLFHLCVEQSNFSDVSLMELVEFKGTGRIVLRNTAVTPKGARQFFKSCPKVEIYCYERREKPRPTKRRVPEWAVLPGYGFIPHCLRGRNARVGDRVRLTASPPEVSAHTPIFDALAEHQVVMTVNSQMFGSYRFHNADGKLLEGEVPLEVLELELVGVN